MNDLIMVELLQALAKLEIGESEKGRVLDVVHRVGRLHGSKVIAKQERLDLVLKLYAQGVETKVIRKRLMTAFEIEKSRAYEVIREALKTSGNGRENRKAAEHTNHNGKATERSEA